MFSFQREAGFVHNEFFIMWRLGRAETASAYACIEGDNTIKIFIL